MAQFGGLPEDAVEKLEKRLDDSDKEFAGSPPRMRCRGFGHRAPRPSRSSIKSREERVRPDDSELLADLERMSPHNEAARKLLLRMLGDDHAETAQEAHRILAELELPADQVLGVWTRALSHADVESARRGDLRLDEARPACEASEARAARPLHEGNRLPTARGAFSTP